MPIIFKDGVVSRSDNGNLMREYAEKQGFMAQPRRMPLSSFHLTNGLLLTPSLLFYLELGLACNKIQRFVQYTPRKCLNGFVQSAVNARCQRHERPNSKIVVETMKLLANRFYVYELMDRNRHIVTKHLNDENNSQCTK